MTIITRSATRAHLLALGTSLFVTLFLNPTIRGDSSQSITLAWNPSTDPSVVGYVVYYGTQSQNYTVRDDVGTNTSITISNLSAGLTYYFALTDYNSSGIESPPSGEITYLVPGILKLLVGTNAPGGKPTISFPVAPTHWYEVQGTTNLQTWTTLWQTAAATSNAWVQFTDLQSTALPKRFYRLILH